MATKESYPSIYVTQGRDIEVLVTQEANRALNDLLSKLTILYEPAQNKMTLRSMLISRSSTPHLPAFAIGGQVSSEGIGPTLRFEVALPRLAGTIGRFAYTAMDVTYVVELSSGPVDGGARPPSAQPLREASPDWNRMIGIGLTATAAAIIVGTLIEDFLSGGIGIADDPASFALAGATYAKGMSMIRGLTPAPVASAVLPKAVVPAVIQLEARIEPANRPAPVLTTR